MNACLVLSCFVVCVLVFFLCLVCVCLFGLFVFVVFVGMKFGGVERRQNFEKKSIHRGGARGEHERKRYRNFSESWESVVGREPFLLTRAGQGKKASYTRHVIDRYHTIR